MHQIRYVANIMIEAETPLSVGSGDRALLTDSPILRDANGLPIIHGTSIAGVLRSYLQNSHETDNVDTIFGFKDLHATTSEDDKSCGSRLIVSHAHIIDENGIAVESLCSTKSDFLKVFEQLPIRQHCKINDKGAADTKGHGKFDTEVVFKGTRFKFSLELLSSEKEDEVWKSILNALCHPSFRIGGGSRKGFGRCKIVCEQSEMRTYYLEENKQDLDAYLEVHSLNDSLNGEPLQIHEQGLGNWEKYTLRLIPESTWMFSCGFGDKEADNTPVTELCLKWKGKRYDDVKYEHFLVPATSIKGAISHRVAFHYNALNKVFSDDDIDIEKHIGEKNIAVKALFGCAKNSKENIEGQRGNVIISDLFLEELDLEKNTKVFNHVAIDRFTQAPIDGALFNDKVVFDLEKREWNLEILVNKAALEDKTIKQALDKTLEDIRCGMLPLGGSVMKGHGAFEGVEANV